MNKAIKYILVILLFLSGFASLASSYVVWFVLPHGMGLHGGRSSYCGGGGTGAAGNYQALFGLFRYTWIEFHNWTSVALAIIVCLHIIIHWNWIVETTKRISSHLHSQARKVLQLYGATLILFILFAFDCLSGLVVWLVLPRGAGDYYRMVAGSGRTFIGLQRNVWVDLHAWIAVTIVSIIIIHLILNWSWMVGVTKLWLRRNARSVT